MKNLIIIIIIIVVLIKPLMSLKCFDYCQCSQLESNNNTYNLECISTNNNEQINLNQEIIKINNLKLKGSNSIELLINLLFNNSKIESIKSLDLSSNEITDNLLSTNLNNKEIKLLFIYLIELNLSNNKLLILKEKQFYKLEKLQILDLSFNQIFYIEMNTFYGLNNVLYLYLQNNHLTELYEGNLDNLPQCKLINLDLNKINKIKRYLFTKMISIETISFQFNRLKYIHSNAFNKLEYLKNISFYWNKLNDSFNKIDLNQINKLNLSSNKLKYFNATNIKNIQILDLSSNQLEQVYFHDYIYSLKYLNLNNNNLSKLNIITTSRNEIIGLYMINLTMNSIWKLQTLLMFTKILNYVVFVNNHLN